MFNRGLIDGCFDGFHYGHVNAIFQAKKKTKFLCVATHLDEEIYKEKGTMTIFNYSTRKRFLQNCRFIDCYVGPVKYLTDIDTLKDVECDVFFHGTDGLETDHMKVLKDLNKLDVYNRTNGISTSKILARIEMYKNCMPFKRNIDIIYLRYLYDTINSTIKDDNKNIVVLKCNWDLLNDTHLDILENINSLYPNYSIYIDLLNYDDTYDIFSKYEIAIALLGLKLVGKILISENVDKTLYNDIIYISKDNRKIKTEIIRNLDIEKYRKKIKKRKEYYDLYFYRHVIKKQFENILYFLKSKDADIIEKDHIIFDIDEVCLCNLMYHGITIDGFPNNIYTYENGLIPINEECKELFDYIHTRGINYSFITGRRDYIKDITVKNLEIEGLNKYTYLFTCPNDYIGNISRFKESCREKLKKEYNIFCCIGDQISDVTGNFTGQQFLIFNPYYVTK